MKNQRNSINPTPGSVRFRMIPVSVPPSEANGLTKLSEQAETMRSSILTLTTDFGIQGPYVAAVKGIVLGLAPKTVLVDVTHTIAPQNVLEGAFVLGSIVGAFPPGTVHLGVVDPGVGTDRRIIAVEVADQWFIAPDNGLLTCVVRDREPSQIRHVVNPSIRREHVSSTFHGRDIMAPAAAFLLGGGDPSELGPRLDQIVRLSNFSATSVNGSGSLVGEVVFRDSFGNLITNLSKHEMMSRGSDPLDWVVEIAGERIEGICRTYGERLLGSLIALYGSEGWLEIAVVNGDAARSLAAGPGMSVWAKRRGYAL